MSMYERYAKGLSEELFESVYDDLFRIAMRQQKDIYRSLKKKSDRMWAGEAQQMLNGFCADKVSLGEALDYIKVYG